ncbi:MAG TPA: PRC-barrel domain-containing protein [Candidatus Saccharimonadales bacterium]|nr:PRC-barrel domain-containing protein [Candidatus Saccharimonadales bacterium]
MFVVGSSISKLPIMALDSGTEVANVSRPVIDSKNLEVPALICFDQHRHELTLATRDIRQVNPHVILINSIDDLSEPDEVVRLKSLLEDNFSLIGLSVRTETGTKIGKVADYIINIKTFMIQKLYVKQSILKNMMSSNLSIDRRQIVDVTKKTIVVRDASISESLAASTIPVASE